MDEIGGLGKQAPLLVVSAAATFATIGLPGFGNFWGEFMIFLSLGEYTDNYIILSCCTGIILSAIFGLRAMSRIFRCKNRLIISLREEEFYTRLETFRNNTFISYCCASLVYWFVAKGNFRGDRYKRIIPFPVA